MKTIDKAIKACDAGRVGRVTKRFKVDAGDYSKSEIEKLEKAGVKKQGNYLVFSPGIIGDIYSIGGEEGIRVAGVEVDVYDIDEFTK